MSPTLHVMKSNCPLGSSRDSSVSRAPPCAVSAAVALSPHLPGHPWGPTLLPWALQGCIPPPQPVPCSCPLGAQPTSGLQPPQETPATLGCFSPPQGAPAHLGELQPPWETPATSGCSNRLGRLQPPWVLQPTSRCSSPPRGIPATLGDPKHFRVLQLPQGVPTPSGCSSHLRVL